MQQQHNHVGCHPRPAGPFNNMDVQTLERGDVRADNGEGRGIVLAMVLIENVLMLLLMIEQTERKPTTAMGMAMETAKQQSNTVLGVALKYGPAIYHGHD